jgi:membrane protein
MLQVLHKVIKLDPVNERTFSLAFDHSSFSVTQTIGRSCRISEIPVESASSALIPGPELLLHGISALVSLAVFTWRFAMMFKILPDAFIAWRHVGMGALVTAVLFTIGKAGIGLYLGKTGLASAYGAASSLAVILLWVYYSSLILFFGAEYTYVTARQADAAGAKGAERRSQQRRSADRKPEEPTAGR